MNVKIKLKDGTVYEFFDAAIDSNRTDIRVTQYQGGIRQAVMFVDRVDLKKLTIKP